MPILICDANWNWNVAIIMNIAHVKILIYLLKICLLIFNYSIAKSANKIVSNVPLQNTINSFILFMFLFDIKWWIHQNCPKKIEHKIEKIETFCGVFFYDSLTYEVTCVSIFSCQTAKKNGLRAKDVTISWWLISFLNIWKRHFHPNL